MEQLSKQYYLFGTIVFINIEGPDVLEVNKKIVQRLYDLQNLLSIYDINSEINMLNNLKQRAPVKISEDTFQILLHAYQLAKQTKYAFNPFLGKLTDRLRNNQELSFQMIPMGQLTFFVNKNEILFDNKKLHLDLGAIGKGYAADCVNKLLSGYSGKVFINFGGHIFSYGLSKKSLRVGIQHPFKKRGEVIQRISLPYGYSLVTSGVYERVYAAGHHILDTQTGMSAKESIVSATIMAPSNQGAVADALTTALIVQDIQTAQKFMANNYPTLKYLLVDNQLHCYGNLK